MSNTSTPQPNPTAPDLLAQLAAALTPEAYQAIDPILRHLHSHISEAEVAAGEARQNIIGLDQFRMTLHDALRDTIQINVQPPSAPQSSAKTASLHIDLPTFKGLPNKNIRAWLSIVEDQLTASKILTTDWVLNLIALL